MKEPILDYLEFAEPENKFETMMDADNDHGVDMEKLALNRKRTMQQWKTKVNTSDEVNADKKLHHSD